MKKLLLSALGAVLMLQSVPAKAATPVLLGWHRFHRVSFHRPFHRVYFHRHYYRPYFYGGWRWGWGWGWGYPADYAPYYPYGYARAEFAAVKTDVSPEEARVSLDGQYIGTADDFDGWPDDLYLKRGRYRLEFRLEGYETLTVDVDARPGQRLVIDNKLRKIPGAKRYGSYDTPRIEGGIRRYWAKRKDVAEAVPEDRPGDYDSGRDYDRNRDSDADRGYDRDRRNVSPGEGRQSPDEQWRGSGRAPDATVRTPEGAVPRGRLRLHIEPPDAAVYLDDRFLGTAEEVSSLERGVAVSAGKHTVTVSRPGFKDRSKDVEVKEGESERVELTLER